MTEKIFLVRQSYNKYCCIEFESNLIKVLIPTNFKEKIVTGDFIKCKVYDGQIELVDLCKRKNKLIRPNVANVDLILIIYPSNKNNNDLKNLLWWILMYEILDFQVIVVFSKSDLINAKNSQNLESICSLLKELNVSFFDYRQNNQLTQLLDFLKNKIVILSGYSGAGKSTFLNFIQNDLKIKTNSLSSKGTGKHTTTSSSIYEIKNIMFIDSPGFSSLNLNLSQSEISYGWHKFRKLQTKCKYSNCLHNLQNDNCAIIKEFNQNKISKDLYKIYLSILNSSKN